MLTPPIVDELEAVEAATGELAARLDAVAITVRKLDLNAGERGRLYAFWAEAEWLLETALDVAHDELRALDQ